MLYTYSTSEVSRSDLNSFSNGCSNWACHCLCVHCLSASCLACQSPESCFLACYSNTSNCRSLVYLLSVFLLSPIPLSHTPAMICLSTEHASSTASIIYSIHVVSARASEDIRTYIRAPSTVYVSRHSGAEAKIFWQSVVFVVKLTCHK